MRMPQVSDRLKEVPAQALRGVFAGIGQVLLITDRLRNKTPAHQQVPQARKPERSETAAQTAPEAPKAAPAQTAPRTEKAAPAETAPRTEKPAAAEPRDFDKTGNVRLLGGTGAGAGNVAKITDVPLPNYDELSIASLRARLRNLDVAQVRQLAEYERAHAARADVIAMFERRIAKLEAETSADARAEAEVEAEVEARTEVTADTEAEVEAEAEAEA
jgi:hypothetical protein